MTGECSVEITLTFTDDTGLASEIYDFNLSNKTTSFSAIITEDLNLIPRTQTMFGYTIQYLGH